MHLALWMIFRRRCLNFINVRTAYASKIQAPPTKNPPANLGTTRFREHITIIGSTDIFSVTAGISVFLCENYAEDIRLEKH